MATDDLKKMNTHVTEFDADSLGRSNLKCVKVTKGSRTVEQLGDQMVFSVDEYI